MKSITFLFILLTLSACTLYDKPSSKGKSKRTLSQSSDISREGFYSIDQLKSFTNVFNDEALHKIQASVGALVIEGSSTVSRDKIQEKFDTFCKTSSAKLWHNDLCSPLTKCLSTTSDDCQTPNVKQTICATGFFRHQHRTYAISTRHCLFHPLIKGKSLSIRVLDNLTSHTTKDYNLTPIVIDEKTYPFGLALFEVVNYPPELPAGTIRLENPESTEPSLLVGFPNTQARTVFNNSYEQGYAGLRVSTGNVLEPNPMDKSFCTFSVMTNLSLPENWTLEDYCPTRQELEKNENFSKILDTPYPWAFPREEKGPIVTSNDMVNGMSGGPLFDQNGQIIGIGSVILRNGPPLNYNSGVRASFSKAKHALTILNN